MNILFYSPATNSYLFKELIRLACLDGHASTVIVPNGQYKNFFDDILPKENILYLYERFNEAHRDYQDIDLGASSDNIYKIMSSDKDGYRHEGSKFQLSCAQTIYDLYEAFLVKNGVEYVVFPDVETVDGILLMNLCYKLNIEPLYFVSTRLLGKSFISDSYYEKMPKYFGDYNEDDLKKAEKIVAMIEAGEKVPALNLDIPLDHSEILRVQVDSLLVRIFKSYYVRLRYEKHYRGEDNLFQKIRTNILPIVERYRGLKYALFDRRYIDVWHLDELPQNFILFALQITPESSINTLEQYFVEQERAIDMVRLNMPHNFYLIVKEHPGMRGIRESSFYSKLKKKSGVLICDISVKTDNVVNKAKLVVSITGTIGLECYLKDKPCLLFGRNFFSHLCYEFDSYRRLREYLHKMIFEHKPHTREQKIIELAKIYNVSYDFIVLEPFCYPVVLSSENIGNVYSAVIKHMDRLVDFVK